jgi:hypothetical protein
MKNLRVFHLMFLVATVALLLAGAACKKDHNGNGNGHTTTPPNHHVVAAIKHAEAAVHFGNIGNAAHLLEEATEALTHAKAAQQEMNNPHLDAAVKELEEAIHEPIHVPVALPHAESALKHLKQI